MSKCAKIAMGGIVFGLMLAGAAQAQAKTEIAPSQRVSYDKWLSEEVVHIISREGDGTCSSSSRRTRSAISSSRPSGRCAIRIRRRRKTNIRLSTTSRLAYANEYYAEGAYPGWKTESGRNYILFGDKLKPAGWRMKMSVIEGVRTGAAEPPKAVTSSNLRYGLTATLKTEVGLAEALKQIEKTFNFGSARMLTEADFQWRTAKPEKDFHLFRLDGKEYAVFVTPLDPARKPSFRLEVFEQGDKGKTNLLDTEFTAQEKATTVFGFEDSKGASYFLAFQLLGWMGETVVDGKLVQLP